MLDAVTVNAARHRVACERLRLHLRQEARPFIRWRFNLVLRRATHLTPPRNLAQGRAATGRDVFRAVEPFPHAQTTDKRLRQIFRDRDHTAFNAFARRIGQPWLAAPFSPKLHESLRDNRGRVRRRRLRTFVLGRPDTGALLRHRKRKQDHVGLAKAGWLPGLVGTGSSAVAGWIMRHYVRFGPAFLGSYEDRSQDPDNPELIARNTTPWASRRDEGERILANAYATETRTTETALRALLNKAAAKAGFASA